MKLKSLILLAFVAALSACSFDKSDGIDGSNEAQIREKLKRAYDAVAGTYQGTLKVSGGTDHIIKIRLYRLEEDSTDNSNGASGKKPVLYGTYTKVSPIGPGYEFDGRIFEGKNELVLTNKSSNLQKDDIHTVTGNIVGGHFLGKAITKGGFSGDIDLPLITRENAGGGNSEDTEYYDNLRKQYQEIAGQYEGQILRRDGTVYSNIVIRLIVENQSTTANPEISVPILLGRFHNVGDKIGVDPDGNEIGMSDLNLTSVYNTKVEPRRLTLYGVPIYRGDSNEFRASMDGVLTVKTNAKGEAELQYHGSYSQRPMTFSGEFVLKRTANIKSQGN